MISIEDTDRYGGMYVIGERRIGKTTFLMRQILEQIGLNRGVIVIDGGGDLITDLLVRIPATEEHRTVLLDATDRNHLFGINLFDAPEDPWLRGRTTTNLIELFKRVWEDVSWGPRIPDALLHITLLAYENPGMTLVDVPRLFYDKDFRRRCVARCSGDVRRWWEEYEGETPFQKKERVESTLNKIREWTSHPILRAIVGQQESSIDWQRVMDEGKIVLVRLPALLTGTIQSLLGTAMVNQIMNTAFQRAEQAKEDRVPVAFFCDEFHLFATTDFDNLFNGGGKFHIMTAVAHQQLRQLHERPQVMTAALGAAIKVVFRVSGTEDAPELAKHFSHTPPEREIVGYKAGRELSRYPIQTVMQKGHPDQVVMQIFRSLIAPIVKNPTGPISPDHTAQGLRELDAYFADCMATGKVVNHSRLRTALHFLSARLEVSIFAECLARAHEMFVHFQLASEEHEPYRVAFLTKAVADYTAKVAAAWKTGMYTIHQPALWEHDLRLQADRAAGILGQLTYIAQMLYEDPVYEASAEQEPIYGPVRSYADIENEVTTTLAHLPKFTAMVRVGNDEELVAMDDAPPAGLPIRPLCPWPSYDEIVETLRQRSDDDNDARIDTIVFDEPALKPPPSRR